MDSKTITKEISDLLVLKNLTDAYAEISSLRMKKTRTDVVSSRDFFRELQDIFKDLELSYKAEVLSLIRKKGLQKGSKVTFLSHNGRKVALFISANTGFYGNLTKKIFNLFMQEVKEKNMEATIVGSFGLAMFKETAPDKAYSFFDLPDTGLDRQKLADLIKHLVDYDEINIFYGKFNNLANQEAVKTTISAQTELDETQIQRRVKYLFEPSLEEILAFFEKEMFSSVFEQTLSEAQLAKFASRMLAMDQAGEKVTSRLSIAKAEDLRIRHNLINKKQLESLPSIILQRNTL